MIPLFDRLDLAPDAVFLLWCALWALRIGGALVAFMATRWAWRRVGRQKRRVAYRDIEELGKIMRANSGGYAGPAYWPAMDRLRELWVEREAQENDGSPT